MLWYHSFFESQAGIKLFKAKTLYLVWKRPIIYSNSASQLWFMTLSLLYYG